jgi:hypothetical protein
MPKYLLYNCMMTTFHFYTIPQGFQGQNPKYKGGNVKGIDKLHRFWGLQSIMDRNKPLDNWGFEF